MTATVRKHYTLVPYLRPLPKDNLLMKSVFAMNPFPIMPKATSFLLPCILLLVTACSEGPGKECDCSSGRAFEDLTVLEGETLPEDLTCVVAMRSTHTGLIEDMVLLYNSLHNTQLELEPDGEMWDDLDEEIRDWLGGPYVGDCGNLVEGLHIRRNTTLGEKVRIDIKATKVELTRENGHRETAPHWYQGFVTFTIKMTDRDGNTEESNRVISHFVVGTCNRYLAMEEK